MQKYNNNSYYYYYCKAAGVRCNFVSDAKLKCVFFWSLALLLVTVTSANKNDYNNNIRYEVIFIYVNRTSTYCDVRRIYVIVYSLRALVQ